MKKLTHFQESYLIKFFEANFAGWRNIATKLLTKGSCIVAGDGGNLWVGGIGNFIKKSEAEEAIDCTKLTFDLEYFLTSIWFKGNIGNELKNLSEERSSLDNKINELNSLI